MGGFRRIAPKHLQSKAHTRGRRHTGGAASIKAHCSEHTPTDIPDRHSRPTFPTYSLCSCAERLDLDGGVDGERRGVALANLELKSGFVNCKKLAVIIKQEPARGEMPTILLATALDAAHDASVPLRRLKLADSLLVRIRVGERVRRHRIHDESHLE